MEEERDAGDEKGGESVTNPIPIVGGKMKKRGVEYKCESCNKVSWFDFFFSFGLIFERWLSFVFVFVFVFLCFAFFQTYIYIYLLPHHSFNK